MLKLIYIALFSFFSITCYGFEISVEDTVILENFFRTMIEKSEGGYVLYDSKPICINGYYDKDYFQNESEQHKTSVFLREGMKRWKEFNLPPSNIIVHGYNNEDTSAKNHVHILFINKKLFLKTVQENLSLFQYVLGPDVNPQGLLAKLTDPQETFHGVLKDDKVLIGILLGFGTQNSIYVSRMENLHDMLLSAEVIPFNVKM